MTKSLKIFIILGLLMIAVTAAEFSAEDRVSVGIDVAEPAVKAIGLP